MTGSSRVMPAAAALCAAALMMPLRAAAASETWSGTWTRTEPVRGSGRLTLTINDGGKGAIRLGGSVCLGDDTPATVSINGSDVRVDVNTKDAAASFTAKLSGGTMSGSMTVSCGNVAGKGTWRATKS